MVCSLSLSLSLSLIDSIIGGCHFIVLLLFYLLSVGGMVAVDGMNSPIMEHLTSSLGLLKTAHNLDDLHDDGWMSEDDEDEDDDEDDDDDDDDDSDTEDEMERASLHEDSSGSIGGEEMHEDAEERDVEKQRRSPPLPSSPRGIFSRAHSRTHFIPVDACPSLWCVAAWQMVA